ncbi:hypothetical protein [Lysobacter sp. CA199]|uniref:hypothetical protein n=1 Tax=Lysobacter sp. CA199 TaxID=3455608 RepID=UPI003F8D146A
MIQNEKTGPDPVLASLPEVLLILIEDQLSNNESASDEELRDYFIACGLTAAQAERAVLYRRAYATDFCWGDATPIRAGEALNFNPKTGWLEPA